MEPRFTFDVNLICKLDKYTVNNQPAILCFEQQAIDDGTCLGPYGTLTVNLDDDYVDYCNGDEGDDWFYQYVNVNDWPGIREILAEHYDWCEEAGIELQSGHVTYPLYRFKKEAFNG